MRIGAFVTEPGWFGVFTREQAPKAIPNGTRICKVATEHGDAHPIGTKGLVLGSLAADDQQTLYFIEWEPRPRFAVAVADFKIEPHL